MASILIVEDDRTAIEVLGHIISRKFPKSLVSMAYDGEMGVDAFRKERHDVVVTDINMPNKDGLLMAEEIKAISPATRIIVLTAYSDRIHIDRFNAIGISDYFLKPVEFDKLLPAIDRAIRETGC